MSADHPDDDYEDDDRPRRRRRSSRRDDEFDDRRDAGDDQADDYDDFVGDRRAMAQAKVQGPALILIIGGLISTLCAVAAVVAMIVLGLSLNAPARNNDERVILFVYAAFAAVAVPYFAVITLGGFRMKSLRSHSLSMTAAIMAIASIVCLGLCGLLVMPIGIWSLIVLLNPDVKREFQRVRREADDDGERQY